MSGLKGRRSQPQNPHTTLVSAERVSKPMVTLPLPPRPSSGMGRSCCRWAMIQSASTHCASSPGALDRTWASPWGNITMSPAASLTGFCPARAAHAAPLVTTWYSMTCSAPGTRRGNLGGCRRACRPLTPIAEVKKYGAPKAYSSQHIGQDVVTFRVRDNSQWSSPALPESRANPR